MLVTIALARANWNVKWRKLSPCWLNGGTAAARNPCLRLKKYRLGRGHRHSHRRPVLAATAFLIGRGCCCSRLRTCWSTASGGEVSVSPDDRGRAGAASAGQADLSIIKAIAVYRRGDP